MAVDRPIDQFLPGPEGVAGCHDLGGVLLPVDASIPSRRTVRTDIANQARGGVGSGQYRRRPRARKYRQLCATSENLTGLFEGARNSHAFGGAGWCFADARSATGSRPMREPGKNASCFDTVAAGEGRHLMTPFAICYSLFAKARSAAP